MIPIHEKMLLILILISSGMLLVLDESAFVPTALAILIVFGGFAFAMRVSCIGTNSGVAARHMCLIYHIAVIATVGYCYLGITMNVRSIVNSTAVFAWTVLCIGIPFLIFRVRPVAEAAYSRLRWFARASTEFGIGTVVAILLVNGDDTGLDVVLSAATRWLPIAVGCGVFGGACMTVITQEDGGGRTSDGTGDWPV